VAPGKGQLSAVGGLIWHASRSGALPSGSLFVDRGAGSPLRSVRYAGHCALQ